MPKISRENGPSNSPAGLGVTRAHTYPLGVVRSEPVAPAADDVAQVERPAPSAVKAVWVEYAGFVLGGDWSKATKGQIIAAVESAE